MKIEQNSATFGAMLFVTFVFLTQNKFVIEENVYRLTLFFPPHMYRLYDIVFFTCLFELNKYSMYLL